MIPAVPPNLPSIWKGGWGSSRFSEMAQTDSTRMAFAADCKRVIDQFDLDGIDIDWE